MSQAVSPSGELSLLGIGSETAFGSAASPTVWLICDQASFTPTNELLDRDGARGRIGRTQAVAGMFTGKGSLNAEADPDSIEALLAFAFGLDANADVAGFGVAGQPNFQSPITNPANNGAVTTTTTSATSAGNAIVPVAAMTGITVGSLLTIGAGMLAETVQVMGVNVPGLTFACQLRRNHASGVAVVSSTVVPAHLRALQLLSPRPSFTAQHYVVTDLMQYVGCKVSSIGFSASEKSILAAKIALEYQAENSLGGFVPGGSYPSAPSATLSTLQPFTFQNSGNFGFVDGAAADATVMSWDITMDTGLTTDYPDFGNGRLRAVYPEGQTKVSGSMTLGFETETMQRKFWGNTLASTPQAVLIPLVFIYNFAQPWKINASYVYQLQFVLGACKLSALTRAVNAKDYVKQEYKFEAYETANGAQDDCLAFLTNTNGNSSNLGGF